MQRIANVPLHLLGRVTLVLLVVALLVPLVPRAGEPISIVSSGAVVKWFTFPISYRTDLVSGGSPLSKAQFDQLVADGFAAWSTANVSTSAVSSIRGSEINARTLSLDTLVNRKRPDSRGPSSTCRPYRVAAARRAS